MIEKMREEGKDKNKCKILSKGEKIEESTRHEVNKKDKGKITEREDLKIEEST